MPHPVGVAIPAAAVYTSSHYASPSQIPASPARRRRPAALVRCSPDASSGTPDVAKAKLKVGSPIVIVEAPPMLKTAASVPSLRHNNGHVKPGDVGRIIARKPKDVWAVRLAVGTYLLDGKHFESLDVVDDNEGNDASQDE